MFSSLRFRLPAVFLAGVVLAGAIASAIAITLFQDYTRNQTIAELEREAEGLAELLRSQAGDIPISTKRSREATGDRLYYVGLDPFPGAKDDLQELDAKDVSARGVSMPKASTFEFVPPGRDADVSSASRTRCGVEGIRLRLRIRRRLAEGASCARSGSRSPSAWASPCSSASSSPDCWGGTSVSASPVRCYASPRRRTRSPAGTTRSRLPEARGRDEISHLSRRFDEMAQRLREAEEMERNFLMTVSHELRTPLTAIGGHVAALREGVVEDPDLRAASLEVVARGDAPAQSPRRRHHRPRQARPAPLHRDGGRGGHGATRRAGVRRLRG